MKGRKPTVSIRISPKADVDLGRIAESNKRTKKAQVEVFIAHAVRHI